MSSDTLSPTSSPRPADDAGNDPLTTSFTPGDWPDTPTPTPARPTVTEKSALWHSLERVVQEPNAATPSILEGIANKNNPRPLRSVMGDSADYWVTSDDQPLTMRFPTKIDRNGQFARLGPYFNLPPTKGVRLFFICSTCVHLTRSIDGSSISLL